MSTVTGKIEWQHDGTKRTEGEVIDLLYSLVRCAKPGVCVETGTFAGHGAQAISKALEANAHGRLFTVELDPELSDELDRITLPRTDFVTRTDSLAYAQGMDGPVDFAFIDCGEPNHRARVAYELWRRLTPAGLLLAHDVLYYPELLPLIRGAIGAPQLELETLHGLAIWQGV